jgi:VanZ family protein
MSCATARRSVFIPRSMKFFLRYWLPVIVWMALIFGASGDAKSVQHTDGILSHILHWLRIDVTPSQLETMRWFVRKAAHMTEYAVLALLWWRALRGRQHGTDWSANTAWIVLLVCAVYAASDEFHQSFVKDRTPSASDVAIDTCGATIALAIVRCVTWRAARKQLA